MNIRFNSFDYINMGLLAGLGLLFSYFFPVAGMIDQMLSRPWVNGSGYYLRDNWLLVHIGHEFLKDLVIVIAVSHLLIWLVLTFKKSTSPLRQISGMVVLGMLISVSVIGILKSQSIHACPWTLLQVNGTHIDWNKPLSKAGKCFPGGHASAGFSLIILYFAYRSYSPRLARYGLILALMMGITMSAVQMLRGAHFLSHNVWTFWWSWLIDYSLYKIWQIYCLNSARTCAKNTKKINPEKNLNLSD